MGFVGGGGNIAIVSALPLSSFLIVVSIYSLHVGTLHLKFYSCLRLRFPDVETNPGPRRPVAASCRILCSNVRGLSGNLSDLQWHVALGSFVRSDFTLSIITKGKNCRTLTLTLCDCVCYKIKNGVNFVTTAGELEVGANV